MDIASTIKGQMAAPHNRINVFSTSIEDLISAWQYKQGQQGRLKTCHISTQAHTGAQPSSRHMSVAYHAHGQVKKNKICSMNDLYEYLSVRKSKVSYAKNFVAPHVSPILDGFVLARVTRDLGITGKVIPKVINGQQYVAFSGHPGLRNIFTTPIYKANNVKIVNMAIGRLGVLKSIAKGTYITILLAVPLTILESILLDHGDLYALFGNVTADIIKIGIPSLIMTIVGIGATGSATFASLPMGLVITVSVFAGLVLNDIDQRYQLTEKLIVALKGLEAKIKIAAERAAQTVGEGIWGGLMPPRGIGGFRRLY